MCCRFQTSVDRDIGDSGLSSYEVQLTKILICMLIQSTLKTHGLTLICEVLMQVVSADTGVSFTSMTFWSE